MKSIKKGDKVKWKWGAHWAKGTVMETYEKSDTKTIKGKEVTHHGSKENKALLIQNDSGDETLHLESRVEKDT